MKKKLDATRVPVSSDNLLPDPDYDMGFAAVQDDDIPGAVEADERKSDVSARDIDGGAPPNSFVANVTSDKVPESVS